MIQLKQNHRLENENGDIMTTSSTHCPQCGEINETAFSVCETCRYLDRPCVIGFRKNRFSERLNNADDSPLVEIEDSSHVSGEIEPQIVFNNMRRFQFRRLSLDSKPEDVIAMGGVFSIEQSRTEINHEFFELILNSEHSISATVQFLSADNDGSIIFRRLMSIQILAPVGVIVRSGEKPLLDALLEQYGEPELIEDSALDCLIYRWFAIDHENTFLTFDPETKQNIKRICQPGQSYTAMYRRFRKVEAEVIEIRDNFLVNGFLALTAQTPKDG